LPHSDLDCANTDPAPVTPDVNTLFLRASTRAVPDVVAFAVTFGVFVNGAARVPLAPGSNRVFVRFKDLAGFIVGVTSVAVWTQ